MDISPFLPTPQLPPQTGNLREGVLLLKGLMNNLVALPPDKSLLVQLLAHAPLPAAQQQTLLTEASQKPAVPASWQALLGDVPIELLELKLPSGQKIWAATLRTWFDSSLARLPAKSLIAVTPTQDGQLRVEQEPQLKPAALPVALGDLWRKSLPLAQPPKQLLQLLAPLTKPLADLPPANNHPLQPLSRFIERQNQQVTALVNLAKLPASPAQKSELTTITKNLINDSGIGLETKLRSALAQPEPVRTAVLTDITRFDFKAHILKTLSAINQLTPYTTPGDDQWPEHLWPLFLGTKEGSSPGAGKNGNWLLLEALLPSLQKTLAGIQLQQANTAAEQAKNPSALNFEIPLPGPEGWITLSAQLIPSQQAKIDEDGGADKPARAPPATWRLFLEFNLPQNGLLAVQFIWQPGLLRGKVWANQAKLKQPLKDQLKQLQQSLLTGGINAEHLTYSDEPITRPPPPINHPLVDIQT